MVPRLKLRRVKHAGPLMIFGMITSILHAPAVVGGTVLQLDDPQTVLHTEGGIQDIVLGDLDLDNDLDVVALAALHLPGPDGFALIHILRNDGGAFVESTIQAGPFLKLENFVHHLRLGDVTGDGLLDIAFIGTTTPLHLIFNQGQATFGAPADTQLSLNLGTLVGLLGIGDLNADGLADVAVGLPGQVGISDGSPDLAVQGFSNDFNPLTLTVVELTGDEFPDIAYGFRTHVNQGDGTFLEVGTIPAGGALDCVFPDLDGDGDADVACVNFWGDTVSTALNMGAGNFSAATQYAVSDCPIQIRTGDLNGDRRPDLLVTHANCPAQDNTPFVSVLLGTADAGFEPAFLLPVDSGSALAIGDLNGDGLDDVVLASGVAFFGPDGINVLLNQTAVPPPADLNQDGQVDAADLALLLGAWGPAAGNAADFNNDGTVDAADLAVLLGAWS